MKSKKPLIKTLFTLLLLVAAVTAVAQEASITAGQNCYQPGETVTLQYQGATEGDRILFYHNLAMVPMKEFATLTTGMGSYTVTSNFEPGHYTARLVHEDGEELAAGGFEVAYQPIPAGGKHVFVLGDPHVMSPDLVVDPESSSYKSAIRNNRKLLAYSAEILDAVIDTIVAAHPDLVVIPGDMTKDGELLSHQFVAQRLQTLRSQGIPVLVIPGNHDMENNQGRIYVDGSSVRAESVNMETFREIYKDFGWGEGADCDPNSLSYACEPLPGMRLIGVDDCKTASRGWTKDGDYEYGLIMPSTLEWVIRQIDQAVADKKVPVVMVHHQLLSHYNGQEEFMETSATEKGDSIARVFLDHGVRLVLTGHMHIPNITKIWNESRTDSLLEITAASLVSYPSQYRILTFDDNINSVVVESRNLTRISSLEDVQTAARSQIESTLRESVRKLVVRYLPRIRRVVNEYSSIDPALAEVLSYIPLNTESLTKIAMQAFGPLMKKVIFTHCEGNENLKMAEEEVVAEFHSSCVTACDIVFEQLDAETKTFMLSLLEGQFESRGIDNVLRSMMSDTAYLGLPDESQDNDLYYSWTLREDLSSVSSVTHDRNREECIYNLSGQKMADSSHLAKGIYLIRKGGDTIKVLVK